MELRRLVLLLVLCSIAWAGAAIAPAASAPEHAPDFGQPTLAGWERTGPYGGEVDDLLTSPLNPDVVYALSRSMNGGAALHRSDDGGVTWRESTLFVSSNNVEQLRFDPRSPDTLYAVGEYLEDPYGARGSVPYRSRDGGRTWERIRGGLPSHPESASLYLSPAASNVLYLNINTYDYDDEESGLFRSRDHGYSWERFPYPVDPETVYYNQGEIVPAPDDPQSLYIQAKVDNESRIYYSADGGNYWERRDRGLPSALSHRNLLIAPTDANRMYVVVGGSQLYSTVDAGMNWTLLSDPPHIDPRTTLLPHPTRADMVYSYRYKWREPSQFYRMESNGAWTQIPTTVPYEIYHAAVSGDGARLLLATAGGVYASTDNGQSWHEQNEGLGAFEVTVHADPHTPGRLYAAVMNGLLYRSDDNAQSWQPLDAYGVLEMEADPLIAGRWYALRGYDGLYTSNDGGDNWTFDPRTAGARALTVRNTPEPALYLGLPGRILVSTDGGSEWEELPFTFPGTVWGVTLNPADPQELVALLSVTTPEFVGGQLFHSTDGGTTWSQQGTSPHCRPVTGDPPDPEYYILCPEIYALVINSDQDNIRTLIESRVGGHVSRSVDGGATWTSLHRIGGAPTSLRVHPDDPDTLWVGYKYLDGIYQVAGGRFEHSADGGATWQDRSRGLNGRAVYNIEPDPFNPDNLYLGGFGGVFRPTLYYGIYLPLAFDSESISDD